MPGYSRGYKRQRNTYGRYKKRVYRKRRSTGAPDYTVTPAGQMKTMVPGTYRTSKSWTRSIPGTVEVKNNDRYYGFELKILPGAGNYNDYRMWCGSVVPQGTSKNERIGRKISAKSAKLAYSCSVWSMSDAASDKGGSAFAYLRFIAYIDKQTNGTTPVIRDLLDTIIIDGNPTVDPVVPPVPEAPLVHCWRNLDNVDRYIILKDKRFVARMNDAHSGDYLNQPSGGTSAISPKYRVSDPILIKANIKLKKHEKYSIGIKRMIIQTKIGLLHRITNNLNQIISTLNITTNIKYNL